MSSDDVGAWAVIALGAAVSLTATMLFLGRGLGPEVHLQVVRGPDPEVRPEVAPPDRPGRVVDYAIIRGDGVILVGPEEPGAGWLPAPRPELDRPR